jgi:hypothetical protein
MVWLCTLGLPISTIAADCEVRTDLPSPAHWLVGATWTPPASPVGQSWQPRRVEQRRQGAAYDALR